MNTKDISKDFVAIDVEWATRDQQICQIGMAVVSNGEIAERPRWLVRPPQNEYDETLFGSHRVRPEMTETQPTLEELWPEIQPYLLKGQLWAHNAASAEMPAFRKSLGEYGIPCEWLDIRDSMDLFRRPGCTGGNGLEQCAMAMGVPFEEGEHHDALYDAEVLAEILIRYAEGYRPRWEDVPVSTEQLRKSKQDRRVLRLGEFAAYYAAHPSGEEDVLAVLSSTDGSGTEQVIDVFDKGDRIARETAGRIDFSRIAVGNDYPIRGKGVVVTGKFKYERDDIKNALKVMGITPTGSISGKTAAVIVGTRNVGPNKLVAIEEQEAKGRRVYRIVGDADLEALLYGDGHKFFGE